MVFLQNVLNRSEIRYVILVVCCVFVHDRRKGNTYYIDPFVTLRSACDVLYILYICVSYGRMLLSLSAAHIYSFRHEFVIIFFFVLLQFTLQSIFIFISYSSCAQLFLYYISFLSCANL